MLYRGSEYHPLSQSHVRAFTLNLNFVRQTYLGLQNNSLGGAHINEASDHFTAAFNTIACLPEPTIWSRYDDFSVVRGYHPTEIAFHLQLCACPALRLGPQVLVANCKPTSLQCTPSRRYTSRSTRMVPIHDG